MNAEAGPICHAAGSPPRMGTTMSNAQEPLLGRRILLVEDEYVIAMEMERWLRGAGAEVIGPVSNVEHALDRIATEANSLDAAILDVNLGHGERVYPIADRLDALGVPYLFATGDVRIGAEPAYGNRIRLEKPILSFELLKAIEALLTLERVIDPLSS
jgi:CheY-like chemotaxis protein